jgi:glycosyltransferase involved in cell wall biosynthesis
MIAGPISPGREKFLVPDVKSALQRAEGAGTFGVVCFRPWNFLTSRTWETWSFAPGLLWQTYKHFRTVDCISLHSLYSFPVLVGYLLARLHRKPYGLWPHGVLAPFQRGVSPRKKWLYDNLVAKRMLNNASVLFFTASGEYEEAAGLRLRAPVAIVPEGMDASEFLSLPPKGQFRRQVFPGQDIELVVFLARLNAKKGLDLLIRAMAKVISRRPRARLAIVGPPDPPAFERKVSDWIRECGIDGHVVVTGLVSQEKKGEVMADADVFALPSQAENFGYSVFEAMASRVPVVVSDTINYAGEISLAGAGIAVPRNPECLADAIISLLADPDLRHRMGLKGLELARKFDWAKTGLSVERVFDCILNRRGVPSDLAPRETDSQMSCPLL